MKLSYNNSIKLTIHLLFWVFYFVSGLFSIRGFYPASVSWMDIIDYKLLFTVLVITYINDLFLLPYFFKKKKYVVYSLIISAIILLAAIVFCYFIINCSCSPLMCFSDQLWKFLLPVVFLSFIWVMLTLLKQQKELEKTDKERKEMELKFLKSQINPHVLFNNLNTVYAQAVKGSDNVADMILMLSDNLKYILFQSEANLVPLEKDVEFIENYLAFQKLRTEGINNIVFTKNVDSYNHQIPPLLLIGLIENAFKHSSYKENKLSDIIIHLKVVNGKMSFSCTNEVGLEDEQRETEGFQIGLKNLKKRLALLYPNKHSFIINHKNDIFMVNLEIDLS